LSGPLLTGADPNAEYARRLATWRGRITHLDRVHLFISNLRLLVAGMLALALWLAFVRATVSAWWPVAALVAFGALVVVHARALLRLERARRAQMIYLRAIGRLAGRWSGTGRDGARFLEGHPYAHDLDLFGPGSLFELLNTARTEAGEEALAGWLGAGAPFEVVMARQSAVEELRHKIDFREDLAILASETEVSRTGVLANWASATPVGLARAAAVGFAACAAGLVAIAWLVYRETLAPQWLVGWLVAEYMVAMAWHPRIRRVLGPIATPERDLSLVSELLIRLESEPCAAPHLAALKASLFTQGVPASRRVAQLRRYVSWLDSARNQIFAPFLYALLLPQQLAVAIDRWHARYGAAVLEWLRKIGEIEALSAFGMYAYEHPFDPFPSLVVDGTRLFHADAMRHPLMAAGVAVANDVRLGGPQRDEGDGREEGEGRSPRVIVVSGSNMSGKSTLLRSIGVNVVLALAGAPVRAARLTLSPLAIGATLRIDDSLQAGHSRFYAEILRIKSIVETARGGEPLLFLLDEILHGTNSYDRRIGAEAVVASLVRLGAIGLITTHDLALTELPSRLGPVAVNRHFEDRLENGRMVFDYRMRPGVVEHSNALALMRAIGLDV
jgi:hypothetical protein